MDHYRLLKATFRPHSGKSCLCVKTSSRLSRLAVLSQPTTSTRKYVLRYCISSPQLVDSISPWNMSQLKSSRKISSIALSYYPFHKHRMIWFTAFVLLYTLCNKRGLLITHNPPLAHHTPHSPRDDTLISHSNVWLGIKNALQRISHLEFFQDSAKPVPSSVSILRNSKLAGGEHTHNT